MTASLQLSSAEVGLWNWYVRSFPGCDDWRGWCRAVFSEILQAPAPPEARLDQTHCLEPQREKVRYAIAKSEMTIGRGAENDVPLSGQAIGKRHARLVRVNGGYALEDLGSTLGTYIGTQKLAANLPQVLQTGDQFTIFPYTFQLFVEQKWTPESMADVFASEPEAASWSEFRASTPAGSAGFAVTVHPSRAALAIECSAGFLEELLARLLTPLKLQPRAVQRYNTMYEFLLLALLDQANRQLSFPFQFALGTRGQRPPLDDGERGIVVRFSVRLSGCTGPFRIFLPFRTIGEMAAGWKAAEPAAAAPPISWQTLVSLGSVDFSREELRQLEPGDILLFRGQAEILVDQARGWRASIGIGQRSATVGEFFERTQFMEEEAIDRLPVRIHVVLCEKELALKDLKALAPGTVLDLGRGVNEPVRLAVNGRLVGEGELVEIDGKAGVRIISWRV